MIARKGYCAVFVFLFFCCSAASPDELIPLKIAQTTLNVETVYSKQDRERGLQGRSELPENQGMLFVFPAPKTLSFWMKNTRIPLDIAFIDSEGKIFQIEAMKPFSIRPVRSLKKCALALEVRQGWFQENGIASGATLLMPETVKTRVASDP